MQTVVTDHEYAPGFAGSMVRVETNVPAPGVLVLHGGAGPGAHERSRAERLAAAGYVAFVLDLFGEPFEDRAHGIAVIQGLVADPPRLRARLAAACDWLRGQAGVDDARVGAVGFCFGGFAALELARAGAELTCAISVHGGLETRAPASPGSVRTRVLVCTGGSDPFVTREHRQAFEDEMTAAGASWEMHVYGNTQHGFTEQGGARPGCAYNARADEQSWRAVLDALAGR